jgi:hypothetical protein
MIGVTIVLGLIAVVGGHMYGTLGALGVFVGLLILDTKTTPGRWILNLGLGLVMAAGAWWGGVPGVVGVFLVAAIAESWRTGSARTVYERAYAQAYAQHLERETQAEDERRHAAMLWRDERAQREARQRAARDAQGAREREQLLVERRRAVRTISGWLRLAPVEFEQMCADVLRQTGYDVTVTKASGDGGIDLVAVRGTDRIAIQCKRYHGVVDPTEVRALAGIRGTYATTYTGAMLMTTGTFTQPTRDFAVQAQIRLVDGPALVALAEHAYPPLDADTPAAQAGPLKDGPGGALA